MKVTTFEDVVCVWHNRISGGDRFYPTGVGVSTTRREFCRVYQKLGGPLSSLNERPVSSLPDNRPRLSVPVNGISWPRKARVLHADNW